MERETYCKGQADLQKYIKDNASKFDNVKDFEKAILKHFDKPEYKVFDLEKAYSPISLQRQTPLKKQQVFPNLEILNHWIKIVLFMKLQNTAKD